MRSGHAAQLYGIITALTLLVPFSASAQVVSAVFGLFNVVAGVMLATSIVSFVSGFIWYLFLLGSEFRNKPLAWMEYGVSVLFTLIVLLAVVHLVQSITHITVGNIESLEILVAILLVYFGGKWILMNLELWNMRVMVKK